MTSKIFILVIAVFVTNMNILAQKLTPHQNLKSKWGYVNEEGKVVIKYKYNAAQEFSEDLAAVATVVSLESGKDTFVWGYIDKNGKEIIKSGQEKSPIRYKYTEAKPFSNGLAKVAINYLGNNGIWNKKWGYIDKTGKEIIPIKYIEIGDFSADGLVKVADYFGDKYGLHKKWGYFDITGKEIISLKYTEISGFSKDGLAKVKEGDKWGYIDKTGKEIIPIKYNKIQDFSEEGLAKVKVGNYWGCINKTGNEIIPIEYEEIGDFSKEGLAKVGKYDGSWTRWGYINKTGKEIIPLKYFDASNFFNGYAVVKSASHGDKIWGIIDSIDTKILPAKYLNSEVLDMLSDRALLQKEINRIQEEETLIEEVESVLDNDYYSDNCHSVEVLNGLLDKLTKLEKDIPISNMRKKAHLSELIGALRDAVSAQTLTKKYGAANANKIMAGKYEIGMTTEMVRDALQHQVMSNDQTINLTLFYQRSESTSSETWSFDWALARSYGLTDQTLKLSGIDCPILMFTKGRLTSIIK